MTTPPSRGISYFFGRRVRRRLFAALFAFGLGSGLTFWYRTEIFDLLLAPAGGLLSPFDGMPVFTSPTAMMGSTISLAMRGGFVFALPVLTVGGLTLIKPITPNRWWRFIAIFTAITYVNFLLGIAFVYFVMLPMGLQFLLRFGEGVAVPVIILSDYIDLLSSLMFALGVVFEIPPAMYLLAKANLITYRDFKRFRFINPIAAYFLGLFLTPTVDIVNTMMVAIPITILYEVGLFCAWVARPEDGNYMWFKQINRLRNALWRRWLWFWGIPDRIGDWVYEKITTLFSR